jgi:hypothetical protein
LLVLLASGIPAYRNYSVRQSVEQSIASTAQARSVVEGYFAAHRIFPPALDRAVLRKLRYDKTNGALTFVLESGPLVGKPLVMQPVVTGFGMLTWRCRAADIPARYLPSACR